MSTSAQSDAVAEFSKSAFEQLVKELRRRSADRMFANNEAVGDNSGLYNKRIKVFDVKAKNYNVVNVILNTLLDNKTDDIVLGSSTSSTEEEELNLYINGKFNIKEIAEQSEEIKSQLSIRIARWFSKLKSKNTNRRDSATVTVISSVVKRLDSVNSVNLTTEMLLDAALEDNDLDELSRSLSLEEMAKVVKAAFVAVADVNLHER